MHFVLFCLWSCQGENVDSWIWCYYPIYYFRFFDTSFIPSHESFIIKQVFHFIVYWSKFYCRVLQGNIRGFASRSNGFRSSSLCIEAPTAKTAEKTNPYNTNNPKQNVLVCYVRSTSGDTNSIAIPFIEERNANQVVIEHGIITTRH